MILLAYIKKFSFKKDEIIDLFISGNNGTCKIEIINFFNEKKFFTSECKINEQKSPILSFAEGCNWDITFQIHLDKLKLEPDLYIIKCNQNNNLFYIPFVLLNTDKKKDIVVVVNTNTWNAYNCYGEGSFYSLSPSLNCIYSKDQSGLLDSDNICESAICSFDRPFTNIDQGIKYFLKLINFRSSFHQNSEHLFYGEMFLWKWLKKHNYNFDFITDQEVENYDLLKDRKVIMLNCHPEYWSHKMYYNLLKCFDEFHTNLIYLGGNGIWRKVYFNQEKNRIEKMGFPYNDNVVNNYKNPFSVDEFAKNNPVEIPPFAVLGVFYYGPHKPYTYEGFECIDNNFWIFKDTNLKTGDIIEGENGCFSAGNENDFYTNNKLLDDETRKKYFKDIKVLGRSKHDTCSAEIVIHTFKNSKVFSCGSIPFTRCINDPKVTIMIKNVIEKFLDVNK